MMSERSNTDDLHRSLAAFGADLARWPPERAAGAREALLRDPSFRRAWEEEKRLDDTLAAHRAELDRALPTAQAVERLRRRTLSQLPAVAFADMHWQGIAAAMLVAGMLGGAMDVFLTERQAPAADAVVLDPLFSLEDPVLQ